MLMLFRVLTSGAQRDFVLTEQRNPWLQSANAASLCSYTDSTVSHASVSYNLLSGGEHSLQEGSMQHTAQVEAKSYLRLSNRVMTYGSASYTNQSASSVAGTMIMGTDNAIRPFDLLQPLSDAGNKHLEQFNIAGAVGCSIGKGWALGGRAQFSSGNWAKYKDLRHANTLMTLNTSLSAFYANSHFSLGASFLYGRSIESIRFKTYGTTDRVYTVLLEYANRMGETLTYGGDGFIDSNTELPLFNKRLGLSLQASLGPLYLSSQYLHRSGFYGQQSQYTVSYSNHSSSALDYSFRYTLPHPHTMLHWVEMSLQSEQLTTNKTNYRQVNLESNPSVVCYEYYSPTKMSDKLSDRYSLCYTVFLQPSGAIYKWHFSLNASCLYNRQTAYLYPDVLTLRSHLYSVGFSGRHSIKLLGLNTDVGCAYSLSEALDAQYRKYLKHNVTVSLGLTF